MATITTPHRLPTTTTTAAANTSDEAIKARIIKHMNADHQRSLSLYLQHHAGLSPRASLSPTMTDITTDTLLIRAHDAAIHIIPLTPPLTSLSDARPRVIALDRAARTALHLPAFDLTSYDPPSSPLHVFMIVLTLLFLGTWAAARVGYGFVPGTAVYERVLRLWPLGGAEGFVWTQGVLVGPTVGLHALEAAWMGWKLRGFGVGIGDGLWWAWVGSTFLEGFGAHQRFNALVRRKEREAEKRAH